MGLDQTRCEEILSHTSEHAVPRSCLSTNQENKADKWCIFGIGQARATMTKYSGSQDIEMNV